MTAADVLIRLRELLTDDIKPYRYTDTFLLRRVSDAIRDLASRRKDLLATNTWSLNTVSDVTSSANTIYFPERFRDALTFYAASRVFDLEKADTHNVSQSRRFYDLYLNETTTK